MPKLIPKETIKRIKILRQRGYSLPEIKKEIQVGYGSVFRHIQGIEILPEHRQIWHSKRGGSIKRMKIAEKTAQEKAEKTVIKLSKNEKLIFLSALYWGEGNKGDFGLSNSDPKLIKLFVKGLRELFNITEDKLRVSIRTYKDLDKNKCLKFWSNITGVPINKFVSINVLEGKKNGKLPYGICRVRVKKGGDMLKYMLALKDQVAHLF